MHPLDQLMKSVVRIQSKHSDGSTSTGSGFAYNFAIREDGLHVPAIVTNKHVVESADTISFPISVADRDGTETGDYEFVTYPLHELNTIVHPDPQVDLCMILTATIHQYFRKKSLQPALISLNKEITATSETFEELLPLEEVTMIGFPNGIWDSDNNGSIARRGIIATIPQDDYLGQKQFVVDMACFPGSSGSPVYLTNFGSYSPRSGGIIVGTRVKLIGILYAGPQHTASGEIILAPAPTQNRPMSVTPMPINLGYVIKAMELDTFESIAEDLLTSQLNGAP